jgi:hypothetical protein
VTCGSIPKQTEAFRPRSAQGHEPSGFWVLPLNQRVALQQKSRMALTSGIPCHFDVTAVMFFGLTSGQRLKGSSEILQQHDIGIILIHL